MVTKQQSVVLLQRSAYLTPQHQFFGFSSQVDKDTEQKEDVASKGDREHAETRQLILEKAKEAGVIGEKDFSLHWDQLKANEDASQSEADKRAAKVKNISLRLLNVDTPSEVLDLFEEEFINVARDGGK